MESFAPRTRPLPALDDLALAEAYVEGARGALETDADADAVAAEVEGVWRLVEDVEGLGELLSPGAMDDVERRELLERALGGRVREPVAALLAALAEAGRLDLLGEVARQLREHVDARRGKVFVTVTSAVALDEAQRQGVRAALADALDAAPVAAFHVGPEVLGGLLIQVGDRVIDATVSAELKNIREWLLVQRGSMTGNRTDQTEGA